MKRVYFVCSSSLLVLALFVALTGCAHTTEPIALDEYIAKPDPTYAYSLASTIPGQGYTGYVIDLTSQTWRSEKEVDKPVWKHWLVICKPDVVKYKTGLLFIGGGSNERPAPKKVSEKLSAIAVSTGSVVAELSMVPNQPLVFIGDETKKRSEDDTIAYTWDKFLRTGDDTWPVRLAMTKSAVRAMDTVTSFCSGKDGGSIPVDSFVVAGGSKRGLTTWTTGAVDKRVVAIVPFVIDLLNTRKSFDHHYRVYGFWAPAINDYEQMHIMDWTNKPRYKELMQLEDPYQYRHRYTMPKYLVNATGDQFFLPDSSKFYFDDLPGEKYLRYVPNGDHGLDDTDAVESLLAFYSSILTNTPKPKFSSTIEKDGSIHVTTVDKPVQVNLCQAHNDNARDFRVETIGKVWTSSPLSDQGGGVYIGRVTKPEKGWTAFMVELVYDSGLPVPFKFTSGVSVVPNTYPHGPYKPKKIPAEKP